MELLRQINLIIILICIPGKSSNDGDGGEGDVERKEQREGARKNGERIWEKEGERQWKH